MIHLRWLEGCQPHYQSEFSAGADLKAREALSIQAGSVVRVPTGVWIDKVLWDKVPSGFVPELQIRARSGLAFKHGITLANAVGTVDADFPDEIQILLWNFSTKDFGIEKGDRVAQMVLNLTAQLPQLSALGKRVGGFGSTGIKTVE
jgi:dUTP pyrophosphatase